MSKKTYRIYKAGGANEGRIMNPTAQFLARAEEGMQQPSQDEMQMMQQQQQQQLMQLIQDYSQIMQTSPEEVMQELQQSSPENQQILIEEMTQVVQQEQPAEQQQPMERGGYVKMRIKELKEAQEGLEQEGSSVPTINDTPDGREEFVSDFTNAIKTSASDAAMRKQAEEEFDSGNIPMARYGIGKSKRNTRQRNRRAVRNADRQSDMYSRPDRRLLRRGLREGDFTREEMLRGDNVLGKAGYPSVAPPGSTPVQSEEELLYTPEQVFEMLPMNRATPEEEVVQTTEVVEEAPGKNVTQPHGDPYEYKNEDGVLYTRKKGSKNWIKVDPESKAGKAIRKKVYKEELEDESKMTQKEQLEQSTSEIDKIRQKHGVKDGKVSEEATPKLPDGTLNPINLPPVTKKDPFTEAYNMAAAAQAYNTFGTPTFLEQVNPSLAARLGPGTSNMLGPGTSNMLGPGTSNMLGPGSSTPATTSNTPALRGNQAAQSELQKGAGFLGQVLGAISKTGKMLPYSAFANLKEGDAYQEKGDDATEMMKIINPSVGRSYSKGSTRSLAEGGETDLPEARFGRQQRRLNRFLRRQNRRTPMGFGMNQFGIPSSGLNMITPYGVAGSEGMQEKVQGSQGMFPGDFHMSTKYGIFGRPRRVDIDYTGNMPFNFMSPLMTGFFGQGFPTNTAYGGRYQSGIRYEDPITTVAKVINEDQTTTDAEKQTEKRNQNDGKSKGSSKKSEPTETASSGPNRFTSRYGIRGDSPLEAVGLPSVKDVINKNAGGLESSYRNADGSYIVDESRPINPSKLAYDRYANSSIDYLTGIMGLRGVGPAVGLGVKDALTMKLLGQGSSAPKALGAGQRMLNSGQNLLEAPGGTQFTLFQPGGFVDPNDAGYGNPDLYKFISGGMDQADIDYMNSKDVTDGYMAQDGLEVYQDKGEVNETAIDKEFKAASAARDGGGSLREFHKKHPNYAGDQGMIGAYASPVNQRFNNYDSYGNFTGGKPMYPSDPRYGERPIDPHRPDMGTYGRPNPNYFPQQGFPMPGVGYPGGYGGYGGYGRQQYPMQSANPMGMLAGSAFGNTYGFRGAGQPKIFNRAGSYWTQTGFPGQPVDMSRLTSAKFKGRQGLFGPRGKAEFTFGTSGDGKQSTDPLITLDKNKGSMIEGPASQDEGSGYMTNRQFARDQFDKNPNMLRKDKRELRRKLNRGMTQLEYLDRESDVKSMMNEPDAGNTMPSGTGSKLLATEKVSEPMEVMDGSGQMRKQGPGIQSMPSKPAGQMQTDGSEPTGPAAGAPLPQDSPQVQPTYSFGQTPRYSAPSTPTPTPAAPGSTAPSEPSGKTSSDGISFDQAFGAARQQGLDKFNWNGKSYGTNLAKPEKSNVVQPIKGKSDNPYYGINREWMEMVNKMYGGEYEDGGYYEEGGEYDLTEAEIGLIMAAGGMVEYV